MPVEGKYSSFLAIDWEGKAGVLASEKIKSGTLENSNATHIQRAHIVRAQWIKKGFVEMC